MKRSVLPVVMGFALLLLSSTEGWSLPPCPEDQKQRYHNCFGTITFTSGSTYVGEWKDDKQHGRGTETFPNGNKYVGQFRDGNFHGHFTVTYPNGDKYVGEFKDSKRNGQGTATFASGSKYVGEWKNGRRDGQGTFTFADGENYVGELRDDKYHGQGTFTFADGSKYVGGYKDNERNGQGTLTYGNGNQYVGEWKDDNKHGQGTLTFDDGGVKEGIFENGKFLYAKKPSSTVTAKKTTNYSPEHLKRLKETNRCPRCNLRGANLRVVNLSNANLQDAYLQGADLRGANLRIAILQGAYLQGANLRGANLYGTDLRGANLYGTDFRGADLKSSEFVNANLSKANLKGAKLQGANLEGASLNGANLEGANLIGANLIGARLQGARLQGANLNGANLLGAKLDTEGLKIAKALGAINTPDAVVVAKKTPKVIPKRKPVQKVAKRPDDIAVIIANSNYQKLGKGIPNVKPAYTDAKNIKQYFTDSLGVREGNIIYLKDATKAQMTSVLGSNDDHRGKLFNWTKRDVSKVYVYYAGHGAPAGDKGAAYLVPSDADSETAQLTGYPLKQLYKNLGKVPATSITVILEACFSGQSQGGYLSRKTSRIRIVPTLPTTPKKITVISAGAANQVASWEEDETQSLFTKYFLKGMSGEGDRKPYGNENGKVSLRELKKYLDGSMTYYARRYYGRTQQAQIVVNGKELSPTK